MRIAPLLTAAVCVPIALALAWIARDAPPAWPCFTEEPAGQAEAIRAFRAGLAPALLAANLLLAALAARLSADRRLACAATWRPGLPTVTAGLVALAIAATASSDAGLEAFAAALFLLFLAAPAVLVLAVGALAWVAWTPAGAKGTAAAQAGVWSCVVLTFLVAGGIAQAGLEGWCLD